MADYSGYYRCAECGRDGTYDHPITHLPTCSEPGRIAEAQRKVHALKEAKRLEREQTLEIWNGMGDDVLLEELRTLHETMKDVDKYLTELDTEFKIGLSVVNERNLLNQYLRHAR